MCECVKIKVSILVIRIIVKKINFWLELVWKILFRLLFLRKFVFDGKLYFVDGVCLFRVGGVFLRGSFGSDCFFLFKDVDW